jgi:hypothetical protein
MRTARSPVGVKTRRAPRQVAMSGSGHLPDVLACKASGLRLALSGVRRAVSVRKWLAVYEFTTLAQQFSDSLCLRRVDARVPDRFLQIRVQSFRIDRSGYIFGRVEEDRIVWVRLPAEFLNEGFPLFEQGLVKPAASSKQRREAASRFWHGPWSQRSVSLVLAFQLGRQFGLPGFGSCPPLSILDLALGVDRPDHRFPEIVGQDIVLRDVL